ncbi:MAG: hypothetical protein E6I76_15860 [Chloroflexi bacterium]|nr:MAG: hypothetical protein E6I76_15860 [Chloroflexota bacterium]
MAAPLLGGPAGQARLLRADRRPLPGDQLHRVPGGGLHVGDRRAPSPPGDVRDPVTPGPSGQLPTTESSRSVP